MSGSTYIAVCPVAPVNKVCPVELEVIEHTLPKALTYQEFEEYVAPTLIICLLGAWVWKQLRRQVLNR